MLYNCYVIPFFWFLSTEEGCRQCLPGWTVINSMCYFFALSEELSRRSWMDARHFCKRQGSDLLVINSREEHVRLNIKTTQWNLLTNLQVPLLMNSTSIYECLCVFSRTCVFPILSDGPCWNCKNVSRPLEIACPQWILDWTERCRCGRKLDMVGWDKGGRGV